MLLLLPEFEIFNPTTVAEACSLLQRHGTDARVLAGGTDLLVKMKYKRMLTRHLVNIKKIPKLAQICDDGQQVRIGALATIQAIKDSATIAHELPLVQQAASKLGTLHIRNAATLGGNLANASPSAECAPALLTLGAVVQCVGQEGDRQIALEDFFVGPGKTVLRQDELLTEVYVPKLPPHAAGVYLKHSLRRMEVATASAAVVVHLDGNICRDVRIALGAVAPTPLRARHAEAILKGEEIKGNAARSKLFEAVAQTAAEESTPIDDIRGYATDRKKLVRILVNEALNQALARAMQN